MTTTPKPLTRRQIVAVLRKHHPEVREDALLDILGIVLEEIMLAGRSGRQVHLRGFGSFRPVVARYYSRRPGGAIDREKFAERFELRFRTAMTMRKSIPKQH